MIVGDAVRAVTRRIAMSGFDLKRWVVTRRRVRSERAGIASIPGMPRSATNGIERIG